MHPGMTGTLASLRAPSPGAPPSPHVVEADGLKMVSMLGRITACLARLSLEFFGDRTYSAPAYLYRL